MERESLDRSRGGDPFPRVLDLTGRQSVIGLFPDRESADRAAAELRVLGFRDDQLSRPDSPRDLVVAGWPEAEVSSLGLGGETAALAVTAPDRLLEALAALERNGARVAAGPLQPATTGVRRSETGPPGERGRPDHSPTLGGVGEAVARSPMGEWTDEAGGRPERR